MSSSHQPLPQSDPDTLSPSTSIDIDPTIPTSHTPSAIQTMVNTLDGIIDINPKHNHFFTKCLCLLTLIGLASGISGLVRTSTCPSNVDAVWNTKELILQFLPPLVNTSLISSLLSLFTLFHIGWRIEGQRSTLWFIHTFIIISFITQIITVLLMHGITDGWWASCTATGIWSWLYALVVVETHVTTDLTRRFFLIQYDIPTRWHSLLLFIFLLPVTGFHLSNVMGLVLGKLFMSLPFLHLSASRLRSLESISFIHHLCSRHDVVTHERATTYPPWHPHNGGIPHAPAINAAPSTARTSVSGASTARSNVSQQSIHSPAQTHRELHPDIDAELDDEMAIAANLLARSEPYPESHQPHPPATSSVIQTPRTRYRSNHEQLRNMGFKSPDINMALEMTGNDMNAAIDWLTQHST